MASEYCALSCARCGDCCRKHGLYPVTSADLADIASHVGDIKDIASCSGDVAYIARATGVEAGELLSRFCTVATHAGRRGLFARGSGTACPFLAGDTCSIHAFKPAACAIFPDNDGYVTVRRLKDDMRASTVRGEGLSRCAAWALPDDGVLAPDIENTVRFRLREDTDAQYFAGHAGIDGYTIDYLAKLAEIRISDPSLFLATARKYGLLRQLYTGGLPDVTPLIQAERDILSRYCGTYATACMLPEVVIACKGARATFVDGRPGIRVTCDILPREGGEAHFLWRRYGETGVFGIAIGGGGAGYATAFVIHTPCLDDILGDGLLHVTFSDGTDYTSFVCKEGIL